MAIALRNVCLWHKADIPSCTAHVRFSGVKRTWLFALRMSAFDPKRTSGAAAARKIMKHLHAHTRTSSFPLLAATKPLKTSFTRSHDFNFFMLSSQRLMLG